MAVYVDHLFHMESSNAQARWAGRRHGHQWCHMWCDPGDEEALHRIAKSIGMKRQWFQQHNRLPHYDLVPTKRVKAIGLGAIEKDLRSWIREHKYPEARIA